MDVPFTWKQFFDAFSDYRVYLYCCINFASGSLLYALSTWAPTIIDELGNWSASQAHLLTAPVYVFGIIIAIFTALLSDRYCRRSEPVVIGFIMSSIGFIIIIAIPPNVAVGARYFSLFLMVGGQSTTAAGLLVS